MHCQVNFPFCSIIITIITIITIRLRNSKTLLKNTVEIEPQPVASGL